ncbi:MAG TPA: ABC transporter permease [Stackebrandtia sp.]|jgi:ABC-2 type transport system permease protein|uniref:ABC transporter permease n=1 Tax=Stackebrandtia sp. TaxID=2023065 RepID=UPI002D5B3ECF|nr:ABC transporter permease [Stackebrandtia sp.]HZE39520.1 ABC transporter permease [Stackebrandtia sp.]
MRHWSRSYYFLLKWNVLRFRSVLPLHITVQTLLSAGVVLGYAFLIPHLTPANALYLSTGGMTISLVMVGMVMLPSTLSYRKETGLLEFQRSLPVPRMSMMAADATMWIVVAIPGLVVAMLLAVLRFHLRLSPSPMVIPALALVVVGSVSVGYTISYLVKPVLVNLITNVIIVVTMMFAPINFPAERLPDWLAAIHRFLPFEYMAQAIRETVNVPRAGVSALPFVVMTIWAVLGLTVATRALTRRQ